MMTNWIVEINWEKNYYKNKDDAVKIYNKEVIKKTLSVKIYKWKK